MRVRTTTTAANISSAEKISRREKKLAAARAFWLDLHARLQQARTHGITIEEATRRLEEREAAEKAARAARRRVRRRRTTR
jgi:hypothetical protein